MKTYISKLIILLVFCGLTYLICDATVVHATRDQSIDSPLEAIIDKFVKKFRPRGGLTYSDQTSFVVYDLSNDVKLVSINEETSRMAASLIKNFVMLVYFHEVKHGRLQHTNRNIYHLERMIRYSSNDSTNYFIRLIGGPRRVQGKLKANYPFFKQTKIVETIPKNGRTYKNLTSARDLNKFYVQMWKKNLPFSDKMKYYLELPNGDYIYKKTHIPASAKVYNKTGTVYGLIGDSGIIEIRDSKGRLKPYVFTGLIEDKSKTNSRRRRISFGAWVGQRANVLRRVSEKVYDYINGVYRW